MTSRNRRAALTICHECGAWILTGVDHDRIQLEARTEIAPLSWAGEIAARRAGRDTYLLAAGALWARHLTPNRAHRDLDVILAAHECGYPTPDAWHDHDLRLPVPPPPTESECTF